MIPEFKGEPGRVEIFISRCENFLLDLNEAGRTQFLGKLVFKLDGDAFRRIGSKHFNTWSEVKEAIQSNYQETKSLPNLSAELASLRQRKNESVRDFSNRFRDVLNLITEVTYKLYPHPTVREGLSTEQDKVARRTFREGLLEPLKTRVVTNGATLSLDGLMALAMEEEPYAKPEPSRDSLSGRNPENRTQRSVTDKVPIQFERRPKSYIECSFCKKVGHSLEECYLKRNLKTKKEYIECSYCNKPGHGIQDCYSHKNSIERDAVSNGKIGEERRFPKNKVNLVNTETRNGNSKQSRNRRNPFSKNSQSQTREISASRLADEIESHH